MTKFSTENLKLYIGANIYGEKDPYLTLSFLTIEKLTKHFIGGAYIFSPETLCCNIYGGPDQNEDRIAEACKVIAKLGYIHKIKSGYYSCSVDSFFNLPVPFTYIREIEYESILATKNHNMPSLLHYFVHIISTINYETGWGYTAGGTFAKRLGVSSNTIYAHNKILTKAGLITFWRREKQNYNYMRAIKFNDRCGHIGTDSDESDIIGQNDELMDELFG